MLTKLKGYGALLFMLANFALLSWFVGRYAPNDFAPVVAVSGTCAILQKIGIVMAAGNLGWLVRGSTRNLGRLATFKGKENPLFLAGFLLNRGSSLFVPLYAIVMTWGTLPPLFVLYLAGDAATAVWAAAHFEDWIRKVGEYAASKGTVDGLGSETRG